MKPLKINTLKFLAYKCIIVEMIKIQTPALIKAKIFLVKLERTG